MVSFWIDYGTNFIGGTGDTQSEASWRIPLALQLVPALILGFGILFMPFSPRWLVNQGRDDEAIAVISKVRNLPVDSDLIQIEFLWDQFPLVWTITVSYSLHFSGRSKHNTSSRRKFQLSSSLNTKMGHSHPISSLRCLTTWACWHLKVC